MIPLASPGARLLAAVLLLWSAGAAAQFPASQIPYPNRPIRLVVPFPPGSHADIVARVVADGLTDELEDGVVVENKPGANAAIGAEAAARAKPDGYTLLLGTAETHALNPHLSRSLPYEPLKELPAIGIVDRFAFSLVVAPKLPVRNLGEFLVYAKQNDGKLNFASWGNGSTSQVAFEQIKQATGLKLVHVPFQGAAQAIAAVTADSVQAFVVPLSVARPQAQAGRVKLLAVTSEQREDAAPEVPTALEQGVPVVISGWHVLAVPAGTPAQYVARLNAALNAATARPEVREKLLKAGVQPVTSSPRDAQAMVEAEWRRWGEVAIKAGLQPE